MMRSPVNGTAGRTPDGEARLRIVDTHLHLIYPDRFDYPWLEGVPALNRAFTLDDYLAEARSLGIEAALHMEVDVAEADMEAETQFVTGLGAPLVGVHRTRAVDGDLQRRADPRIQPGQRCVEFGHRQDFAYPQSRTRLSLPHQLSLRLMFSCEHSSTSGFPA